MYHKILVCMDHTPLGEQAVRVGADLACRYDADIALLSVLDPTRLPDQPYSGLATSELLDRHNRSLSDTMRRSSAMLHDRGLRSQQIQLMGHSADTILQWAEKEKADLIIVGTEAQGRMRAWLNNDIWSEVAHKAPCHVLRVTPQQNAEDEKPARPRRPVKERNLLAVSLSAL